MDEDEKGEMETRRNTSHNEVIDADNPQTPEEVRVGTIRRIIIMIIICISIAPWLQVTLFKGTDTKKINKHIFVWYDGNSKQSGGSQASISQKRIWSRKDEEMIRNESKSMQQ